MATANACLQAFAEKNSDGIIQVSTGGGQFASGLGVADMAEGAAGADGQQPGELREVRRPPYEQGRDQGHRGEHQHHVEDDGHDLFGPRQ